MLRVLGPGPIQCLDLCSWIWAQRVKSEPVGEAVQSSPRNLAGMQAHKHAPTGMLLLPRFGTRTVSRLTWLCHVGKQAILGEPIHPVSGRRCQQMSALLSVGLQASLWSFTHTWHPPANEGLPVVSILSASSKWRPQAFARSSDCWKKWTTTAKSYLNGISLGTWEGSACHLTPNAIFWLCPQSWTRHGRREAEWKIQEGALGTSLVVQWLRVCTPNAGGLGSIPGQGTRSHMPRLKSPYATTKYPTHGNGSRVAQLRPDAAK